MTAPKLTVDIVKEARSRNREGETVRSIANDLGVNENTLIKAVRGKTWKHVRGESPVPPGCGPRASLHDYKDRLDVFYERYQSGESVAQIADDYEFARATLGQWFRDAGYEMRPPGAYPKHKRKGGQDEDEVYFERDGHCERCGIKTESTLCRFCLAEVTRD